VGLALVRLLVRNDKRCGGHEAPPSAAAHFVRAGFNNLHSVRPVTVLATGVRLSASIFRDISWITSNIHEISSYLDRRTADLPRFRRSRACVGVVWAGQARRKARNQTGWISSSDLLAPSWPHDVTPGRATGTQPRVGLRSTHSVQYREKNAFLCNSTSLRIQSSQVTDATYGEQCAGIDSGDRAARLG
jgi:hypothetical protein